jgi:hypothetical protein
VGWEKAVGDSKNLLKWKLSTWDKEEGLKDNGEEIGKRNSHEILYRLLLGICFWREGSEAALGPERRAIEWLILEGSGFGEEAEGLPGVAGVVVQGRVQGVELCQGDEGEEGSAHQAKVFGPVGVAAGAAVFAPAAGVALPVVFVFNTPLASREGGELGGGLFAGLDAGDEDPAFDAGLPGAQAGGIAGDHEELPGAGEGGGFLVKFDEVEVAQVNATVTFFRSAPLVGVALLAILRRAKRWRARR